MNMNQIPFNSKKVRALKTLQNLHYKTKISVKNTNTVQVEQKPSFRKWVSVAAVVMFAGYNLLAPFGFASAADGDATLKVITEVINHVGVGTLTASDFSIHVTQGSDIAGSPQPGNTTGTTYVVTPGAYTISADAVFGYQILGVYGTGCNVDGTVTLVADTTTTCTIYIEDIPPVFKYKNVVIGGTKVAADFSLFVNGSPFPSSSSFTDVSVLPGQHYTVTQTADANYTTTFSAACDVTMGGASDVQECTVTNTFNGGTLTVIKHVINDNAGTSTAANFTMNVTGTNVSNASFAGSEAGTLITMDAGDYSVDEADSMGYNKTLSADCIGTIAAGEVKTCTVTNDDPLPAGPTTATLIVKKEVQNYYGGSKNSADFTLTVTGNSPSPSSFTGDASGTVVTLNPGAYDVTEVLPFDYRNAFVGDCSGTILAGEVKTCRVINVDIAPQLRVIKTVVGGTNIASDFTINVNASHVTTASFPGNASGTIVAFVAGAYSADEADSLGYVKTLSPECSGSAVIGEVKTCVITNTMVNSGGGGSGSSTFVNLVANKTTSNSNPNTNDVITYTLTIANTGTATATNVTATDTLASGLSFQSYTGNGTYASSTGIWTIGDLASGQAASINIVAKVTATAGQSVVNTVVAGSDATDSDPADNTSSVTISVPTSGGGSSGGSGGGGSSGGSGIPVPPSGSGSGSGSSTTTGGSVLGDSTNTPSISLPIPQVLGAATELPRTGMNMGIIALLVLALVSLVGTVGVKKAGARI